ncbi:MAG TPA: DUF6066 family protein [Myxococcaceae bacterium]|nr:DUF6066 family protein [Myxococcaceae bacterium]HYB43490.1 DUF6066 family protein [Candidatus Methylomirabilis sp.]
MWVLGLWPLAASAGDARFDALRAGAQTVDGGLTAFLEQYTGDCGDASNTPQCRQKADAYRKAAAGRRFYALLREDAAGMVAFAPGDQAGGDYTVLVTPFFAGGPHAFTTQAPKKTDARGNPIFPRLALAGVIPEGETDDSVERLFRRRGVRVEILFTPEALWSLPRKGEKPLTGCRGRLDALLVTTGDGAVLARYEPR